MNLLERLLAQLRTSLRSHSSVDQNWQQLPSGVMVPLGTVHKTSRASTNLIVIAKDKANQLGQLFAKYGISVAPQSYLADVMAAACEVSDASLMAKEVSFGRFFQAVLLDRIADAILLLDGAASAEDYLKRLRHGNLELLSRTASDEKNILWELELLFMLRVMGFEAILQEPPDIVVQLERVSIGIACKKSYSEKGVSKAISEGVAQIEGSFDYGIVALSLDDLFPENTILRARTMREANENLAQRNRRFMGEHQRHMARYLRPDRLISVLVSTAALVELTEERPQFANVRQTAFWSLPGSKADHSGLLKKFRDTMLT